MTLHPDAAAFLKAMEAIPQPPEATVEQSREATARLIKPSDPLPIAKVEDRQIEGGDGQPLTIRIYTPEGQGPFPAIVWIRGGSFTRTTLEQMDPIRRLTAKTTGCVIVAVDQRLSPETHYPGPLDDAEQAARWTFAHAGEIEVNPDAIGVGGESSGGNLAAALAIRLRDRGGPKFAFQVLFAPLLDATLSSPSIEEFAEGYLLTKAQLVWAYDMYAPDVDRTKNDIAPLLVADTAGLPPTTLITIENDPVRDEGERYVERLREAGIPVKHARLDGMVHHFPGPDAFPTMFRLIGELLAETGLRRA